MQFFSGGMISQAIFWWRHQMETFSALLAPHEVRWRFFDLRLNKRLSKQPRSRWFETPLPSLCRHCNAILQILWREAIFVKNDLLWIFDKYIHYVCLYTHVRHVCNCGVVEKVSQSVWLISNILRIKNTGFTTEKFATVTLCVGFVTITWLEYAFFHIITKIEKSKFH